MKIIISLPCRLMHVYWYHLIRYSELYLNNKINIRQINILQNFIRKIEMKIQHVVMVLCLTILVCSSQIYMATVFRHGARYPLNNMYDGKQTAPMHGQLTSVGLRQQFLLGSYILSDYSIKANLFNSILHPRQIEFFTLFDSQRCIQSAYGHAAGLFSFGNGQKIDPNIKSNLLNPPFETFLSTHLKAEDAPGDYALENGFQPVPIRNGQQFFPKCENQANIFIKRGEKIAGIISQFQTEHLLITQKMKLIFNLTLQQSNVVGLAELYDTLVADTFLGRPLPHQLTTDEYQKLSFIQRYLFTIIYEEEPAKIFNAPFVHNLISNMENLIKGNFGVKKLSAYSAHDSNVVPLLVYFNLTSSDCLKKQWKNQTIKGNCAIPVPFASSIFFELHQNDRNSSNYFVKIRYNGKYYNLCEKNSTQCQFNEFAQRSLAHLMNFQKECSKKESLGMNQIDLLSQ